MRTFFLGVAALIATPDRQVTLAAHVATISGPAAAIADTCVPRASRVAGSYDLAALEGSRLPASFTNAFGKTKTVSRGSLQLYDNGAWLIKLTMHDGATAASRSWTYLDMGTSTRTASDVSFKPVFKPVFTGAIAVCLLTLAYDIDSDSVPEKLLFAKAGADLGAVIATAPAAAAAAPAPTPPSPMPPNAAAPTLPGQMPTGAPTAPPALAVVTTASAVTPSASSGGQAGDETVPFDLPGDYEDPDHATVTTLAIRRDHGWEMHWSRASAAPGYAGRYFSSDHGTWSQSGSRVTLRSAEYGDFDARASGNGTLVVEYYFGTQAVRWRFVKHGVTGDPKDAPGPSHGTSSASTMKWAAVSAGAYHACALDSSGRAYCWGLSASPNGSAGGSAPAAVSGSVAFASIAAGSPPQCDPDRPEQSCDENRAYHVCGLTATGSAYCWGNNQLGQLGDGTTNESATPVRVSSAEKWASISAGEQATCGITVTHALFCWGRNDAGQLGIGSRDVQPHPVPQPVLTGVRAVAVGSRAACAVGDDSTLYCWGHGGPEGLGLSQGDEYGASTSPSRVATSSRYTSVSVGRTHVCAVGSGGVVDCWGDNYYGESGPGDQSKRTRTPTAVGGPSFGMTAVGTGYHSCALTTTGAAYCWGLNTDGRLGAESPKSCGANGDEACSSVPVAVTGGLTFTSLGAGLEFTCGITTDGDAYCWGDNLRGQLGTGNRAPSSAPVKVLGP